MEIVSTHVNFLLGTWAFFYGKVKKIEKGIAKSKKIL